MALLTVITSSEVPTATGIENPRARTRAGTTAKPPPTPKNPVSSPTAVAVTHDLGRAGAVADEARGEREDRVVRLVDQLGAATRRAAAGRS